MAVTNWFKNHLLTSQNKALMQQFSIMNNLKSKLESFGLDLFQIFPIETYNAALDSSPKYVHLPRLPTTKRYCMNINGIHGNNYDSSNTKEEHHGENKDSISAMFKKSSFAILVGNSKSIWKPFKSYCLTQNENLSSNPLDQYVSQAIEMSLKELITSGNIKNNDNWNMVQIKEPVLSKVESLQNEEDFELTDIFYPYEMGSRFIHFQKLAHVSGLAYLNEHCSLCVHSTFGPWIALRAVIILQFDPNMNPSLSNLIEQQTQQPSIQNPFPDNDQKIQILLHKFNQEYSKISQINGHQVAYEHTWKLLLEIRDVVGDFEPARSFRYSQEQILYHYLKDIKLLKNL